MSEEKNKPEIVAAEVIYVVKESFMVNDHPSKGACANFEVGAVVEDANILKSYGDFMQRSIRELPGVKIGSDAKAEEKLAKANTKVAELGKANKESKAEIKKLTAELKKALKKAPKK